MRTIPLILFAHAFYSSARILHSLPEDPFAFPKYRVTFLNGLPVSNETAEKWLRDGLQGGEREFLEQPWNDSEPRKEIGSGEEGDSESIAPRVPSDHALERMKMGPHVTYLCLIPPPAVAAASDDPPPDVTPVYSWSLLQPLAGTCIYHRQGWFTYAYCHNSHVRQFREALRAHPSNPGHYEIEEDPEWEAFDLGRAPTTETGDALTVADQNALTANLQLARGPGSRYLVQRWGDGTVCDKTGRRREIEVQFHCSMTMTDTIMFIKETRTCHYVLVIYTPRLCGVPGFKSQIDQREEALVRCRQVVDPNVPSKARKGLPEGDHPVKHSLPAPPSRVMEPAKARQQAAEGAQPKTMGDSIRRTLERLLQPKDGDGGDSGRVHVEDLGNGELQIEFLKGNRQGEGGDEGEEDNFVPSSDMIAEALRSVGYDVRRETQTVKSKPTGKNKNAPKARQPAAAGRGRDEL
ncbi:hypothetical protein DENSPDRAFT_841598 [Dentipellis sp. KUC8613]|nr:hypothetical protein DENSPDRAFT_841598 [Dentipellis sp. KUC8613]